MNPFLPGNSQGIDSVAREIAKLVEKKSRIDVFIGSVMTLELWLYPERKIEVCEAINKLLAPLRGRAQIVLAVMEDDDNVYTRLIGFGITGNEIDADAFF